MLVKLTPQDKADYPGKFAHSCMGSWVVVERFLDGVTYRVRDLGSAEQLDLTRCQFKVVDLPEVTDDGGFLETPGLPRLVILRRAKSSSRRRARGRAISTTPKSHFPRSGVCQQKTCSPPWKRNPYRLPRAVTGYVPLPYAVLVQRKNSRWQRRSVTPIRREVNKGRV